MSKKEELIQTLINCARACQRCVDDCLSARDVRALLKCMQLNIECAENCVSTARLLLNQQEVSYQQIEAVAEICIKCEEESTRKISVSDQCRVSAEACRKCGESCRSYQGVNV